MSLGAVCELWCAPPMSKTLLVLLFTALWSACGEPAQPALVFRPVVAEALLELERALPEPPTPAPPDADFVARVRGRAESLAADTGLMRPMLALSVSDFGEAAAPVLAQLLGESNVARNVRVAAVEMLAVLDAPDAAAALVYHATSNPVSWIRAHCAWRLASTTQDQCVPPLLASLATERDPETRVYLASTLAHFGCPAFGANDAVPAPSKRFERDVWQRLATLRGSVTTKERAVVIDVLGQLPTAFARPLAEALVDEDSGVRSGAALALEAMGPRASVAGPALLASLLRDPTIEVEVLGALGAVNHVPAAQEIERRLADRSREVTLRIIAARSLGRLGTIDARRALETIAISSSEPVDLRIATAGAVCRMTNSESGLDTLLAELNGEHARQAANELDQWLEVLQRNGDPTAADDRVLHARGERPSAAFAAAIRRRIGLHNR